MPKVKTHRGAAKRLKRTASGRFKRRKAYHSHILTKKDRKRKRRLRTAHLIAEADHQRMRVLLPYTG
jgi:large subunit ribosomal protein L35